MIIVDLNQIMISNLMVQINGRNAAELSEDLVRHMVLNSLRGHYKRFRKEYGEMIIACDSGNVWRRFVYCIRSLSTPYLVPKIIVFHSFIFSKRKIRLVQE